MEILTLNEIGFFVNYRLMLLGNYAPFLNINLLCKKGQKFPDTQDKRSKQSTVY